MLSRCKRVKITSAVFHLSLTVPLALSHTSCQCEDARQSIATSAVFPPSHSLTLTPSQYLPLEYGGKNTVPVFDSAEERHLRHLVDTMNANADAHPDGRKKPKSPINMKKAKTNPATPSKTVSKHRKDNKTPVSGGRKKGAAEPANGGTRTPEEKVRRGVHLHVQTRFSSTGATENTPQY